MVVSLFQFPIVVSDSLDLPFIIIALVHDARLRIYYNIICSSIIMVLTNNHIFKPSGIWYIRLIIM